MTDTDTTAELSGMVAIITGGASPIGLAICDRLAQAGDQPVICEPFPDN